MNSMTKKELEEPDTLDAQRLDRISKGSGVSTGDLRDLVKQYKQSKKLMKMFKGEQDVGKLMKKMGGRMPKGMWYTATGTELNIVN